MEKLTVFEHWIRFKPNYGSFQTYLFKSYNCADSKNTDALNNAFPQWFTDKCMHDKNW